VTPERKEEEDAAPENKEGAGSAEKKPEEEPEEKHEEVEEKAEE